MATQQLDRGPSPSNGARRRQRGPAIIVASAAIAAGLGWWWAAPGPGEACENDAITAQATSALRDWGDWLSEYGVQGVVGEVGWPQGRDDSGSWQRLAARWLDVADDPAVNTGVYVWAAGQQWRPSYELAVYRSTDWDKRNGILDTGGPIARILESHLPSANVHGVALADGSFGATFEDGGTYSASDPGELGSDYRYPSTESLAFLAEQGIRDLRVAVTWERLQPSLYGPLRGEEVDLLRDVLSTAATNSQRVVIDLHNFGRYMVRGSDGGSQALVLGSDALPASALADFWSRLARELEAPPGLVGYGIMNEPHNLEGEADAWQAASNEVVAAIRVQDPLTPVYVGGYYWSSLEEWQNWHPVPWIDDPHVVYEAHQYKDGDRRGIYPLSYAEENAAAEASGWTPCGRDPLANIVD
jgi:hypothetical protein